MECFVNDSNTSYVLGSQTPLEVAFLIDGSESVTPELWSQTLEFIRRNIINYQLSSDMVRVAFVLYSESAVVKLSLTEGINEQAVLTSLYSLQRLGGRKDLVKAFEVARDSVLADNLVRPNAGKVIIAIVAGKLPGQNLQALYDVANSLKNKDIQVGVIGIHDADQSILENVVSHVSNLIIINTGIEYPATVGVVSEIQGDAAGKNIMITFCMISFTYLSFS